MSSDRETHWRPGAVWSVWDMLRAYVHQFVGLYSVIDRLHRLSPPPPIPEPPKQLGAAVASSAVANALMGRTLGLPPAGQLPRNELDEQTKLILEVLPVYLDWVPLPATAPQVERLSGIVSRFHTREQLLSGLANLRERLDDDVKKLMFFHILPDDVPLYTEPHLFGETVAGAFPNAADDIEAAGKCLAFRQGTATVFHLMRVTEEGLKALAKLLGIPYAPSWESYITQITNKIGEKHTRKGIKWKKDEPLFRDILGDLTTIKIAWRNPTMHIVRKYTPDEAEEIYRATKRFMVRLSERVGPKL